MGVRIIVDASRATRRLAETPQAAQRAVSRWLPRAGQLGVDIIQDEMRVFANPTGETRASTRASIEGNRVVIGPHKTTAKFANYPTRAHVIEAKNGKALTIPMAGGVIGTRGKLHDGRPKPATRFKFGGKTVYRGVILRQKVRHPGTKGHFFMEKAAARIPAPAAALLAEEIAREVNHQ